MKFSILTLALILAPIAPAATLPSDAGWKTDSRHPDLQFRVKCNREAATIQWRSNYPGEVSAKFSVRSSTYEGTNGVTVPPAGMAETPLDTQYCSPSAFLISVTRFFMAPPPPPPPAPAASAAKVETAVAAKAAAPPPPVIYIPRYQAPEKLPTVSPKAVSSILVGFPRSEVLQTLGAPASQIIIPEESELRETLRYNLEDGRVAVVRLANGAVAEVEIR